MTPDRHITDEEIWEGSGHAPRQAPAVPKATCLRCNGEHHAFYAAMAHDCLINLKERKTYAAWLVSFQRFGYGVLKTPEDTKFPLDKVISGERALTYHLQSDLHVLGYELKYDYYQAEDWKNAGFPEAQDKELDSFVLAH